MRSCEYVVTSHPVESRTEEVRRRRDREQIATAVRARRFSGEETMSLGLELSSLALRIAGGHSDKLVR